MAVAAAVVVLLAPSSAPAAQLIVILQGLRNMNGMVHVCLTRRADHFPDCAGDPDAVKRSIPSSQASRFLVDLPAAAYALSIIHDENGNGRLDTRLGIPREGFGFSNNPRIWFGPPSFEAARFLLPANGTTLDVTIKYMF